MSQPIISGLVGGLVAGVLGLIALRTQRVATVTREGWNRLRPGFMMHLALGGSLIFVVGIAWFFATGGSGRRDAEEQNLYALLLGAAFLIAAAWTLWAGYLRVMEWSGSVIRVRSPLGERRIGFSEIVNLDDNIDGSQTVLRLADGSAVRINSYAHGSRELVTAIQDHFARLMPDLKTSRAPAD